MHPDDPFWNKRLIITCRPYASPFRRKKHLIYEKPAYLGELSIGELYALINKVIREPYAEQHTIHSKCGIYKVKVRDPEESDEWMLPAPKEVITKVKIKIKQVKGGRKKKKKKGYGFIVHDTEELIKYNETKALSESADRSVGSGEDTVL